MVKAVSAKNLNVKKNIVNVLGLELFVLKLVGAQIVRIWEIKKKYKNKFNRIKSITLQI